MLKEQVAREIELLLGQVSSMSITEFEIVHSWELSNFKTRQAARPTLKLSAADFSWLDKQVRTAVGPLLVSLTWPNLSLSSGAVFMVLGACQAVVRRDRLTEEQCEAFMGGFRLAGIQVPGYRDGWAAQAAKQ